MEPRLISEHHQQAEQRDTAAVRCRCRFNGAIVDALVNSRRWPSATAAAANVSETTVDETEEDVSNGLLLSKRRIVQRLICYPVPLITPSAIVSDSRLTPACAATGSRLLEDVAWAVNHVLKEEQRLVRRDPLPSAVEASAPSLSGNMPDAHVCTVAELKRLCASQGLLTTGNRNVLLDRWRRFCASASGRPRAAEAEDSSVGPTTQLAATQANKKSKVRTLDFMAPHLRNRRVETCGMEPAAASRHFMTLQIVVDKRERLSGQHSTFLAALQAHVQALSLAGAPDGRVEVVSDTLPSGDFAFRWHRASLADGITAGASDAPKAALRNQEQERLLEKGALTDGASWHYEGIIVERKAVHDLISSTISPRLQTQKDVLRRGPFPLVVLLIEGLTAASRSTTARGPAIHSEDWARCMSAGLSAVLRDHFFVMHTASVDDTCAWLSQTALRLLQQRLSWLQSQPCPATTPHTVTRLHPHASSRLVACSVVDAAVVSLQSHLTRRSEAIRMLSAAHGVSAAFASALLEFTRTHPVMVKLLAAVGLSGCHHQKLHGSLFSFWLLALATGSSNVPFRELSFPQESQDSIECSLSDDERVHLIRDLTRAVLTTRPKQQAFCALAHFFTTPEYL